FFKKNLQMKQYSTKEGEYVSYSNFYIEINGVSTVQVPMSFDLYGYYLNYEIIPDKSLREKKELCIGIYTKESSAKGIFLDTLYYELPDSRSEAGNQPLIKEITPGAGIIGDTVTIIGKNLGTNVEDIRIQILSDNKGSSSSFFDRENDETETYPFDDFSRCAINPFYLSSPFPVGDTSEMLQELKFTIPSYIDNKNNCLEDPNFSFSDIIFGKSINLKLMTNARPSTIEEIRFLHKKWKVFYGIISIILTFGFMGLLALIIKKANFLPDILLDVKTNSYTLANFQAYVWTIVLLGSYFYVALCQWTILVNKMILPDFNAKLTALLGISFGGSILSTMIQKREREKPIKKENPEWKDLISDNFGAIDVSKLQLLGFTIVTIIIYLLYLAKCNPLKGLPDIPETLHGLLGISQASYLATKAVEKDDKKSETRESEKERKPEEDKESIKVG
ncbi:MAG: IPT/TIG domain-containing protein, partial [Leptospiraceae bacterium]|nr:IPT/TIG domain-containing protein [Leptospiraceae bacterium]